MESHPDRSTWVSAVSDDASAKRALSVMAVYPFTSSSCSDVKDEMHAKPDPGIATQLRK